MLLINPNDEKTNYKQVNIITHKPLFLLVYSTIME